MSNNTKMKSTLKSDDVEEWLDLKIVRPLGYLWTLFFNKLNVHPNTVTVLSMIIGGASGFFLSKRADTTEGLIYNIIGVLLIMWANLYDSADGQLARMTGKKTLWGRLLDGLAGDLWFITISFFLSLRLYDEPIPFAGGTTWGIWVFVLFFGTGFIFHARQAGLSDYYRNIYLLFHGDHSELNDSRELASQQASTPWKKRWFWKIWLFFYQNYTRGQERMTPCFQKFYANVRGKYGNQVPLELGQEFCSRTYKLLKWTNILTFNTRAITLYIILIIGEPWLYPIFELTVMNVIWLYMRAAHEKVCREMTDLI